MDQKDEEFAAIPLRAVSDKRLTAECWRVLSAIAAHHRLGRNGSGCYASHERLAKMARCHTKALSRTLKKLVSFGYLETAANHKDKRRIVYFVVYNEDDHDLMRREKGSDPATDKAAEYSSSGISNAEFGSKYSIDCIEIGNTDSEELHEYQCVGDPKRFSEAIRNHAKHKKINSGEPASSKDDGAENGARSIEDREDAIFLRETEGWLKDFADRCLSSEERNRVYHVQDRLFSIAEDRRGGRKGDNLGGWARRLLDEHFDIG